MRRYKRFFRIHPHYQKLYSKTGWLSSRHILPLHNDMDLTELALIRSLCDWYNLEGDLFNVFRDLESAMAFKVNDYKIVQLSIVGDEVEKFEKWVKSTEFSAFDVFDELLSRNYKISSSWVDKNQAFCVSVTGKPEAKRNQKQTIVSWSNDLEEAFLMSLYKCLEICKDGNWEDYASESGSWG